MDGTTDHMIKEWAIFLQIAPKLHDKHSPHFQGKYVCDFLAVPTVGSFGIGQYGGTRPH